MKRLRKDFPFFNASNPHPSIYLDSAATSHKPRAVTKALTRFYHYYNANPMRGIYSASERATHAYQKARSSVAQFINAVDSSEVIFTSGATEGINFVADTWLRNNLKPGDEILISAIEHHANILPYQRIAQAVGATLTFMPFDQKTYTFGEAPITEKTAFVALTHESNVFGPVWRDDEQLKHVVAKAHEVGARVLLDASQSAPHRTVDVQALGVDFLVFSGHKLLGPTGIGVLYLKRDLHDTIEPYQVGGSMVYSAQLETATWKQAPEKFEAGTPPVAQAIGLHAAIDYLKTHVDFEKLRAHEAALCTAFIEGLNAIPGITILGNTERIQQRGHLVSFTIDGVHPHDVAEFLDVEGIAVRAGHHCAQPAAEMLGQSSSLRVSFYLYNTIDDVKAVLKAIKQALKTFEALR